MGSNADHQRAWRQRHATRLGELEKLAARAQGGVAADIDLLRGQLAQAKARIAELEATLARERTGKGAKAEPWETAKQPATEARKAKLAEAKAKRAAEPTAEPEVDIEALKAQLARQRTEMIRRRRRLSAGE